MRQHCRYLQVQSSQALKNSSLQNFCWDVASPHQGFFLCRENVFGALISRFCSRRWQGTGFC